jgi:hypothetical protein
VQLDGQPRERRWSPARSPASSSASGSTPGARGDAPRLAARTASGGTPSPNLLRCLVHGGYDLREQSARLGARRRSGLGSTSRLSAPRPGAKMGYPVTEIGPRTS